MDLTPRQTRGIRLDGEIVHKIKETENKRCYSLIIYFLHFFIRYVITRGKGVSPVPFLVTYLPNPGDERDFIDGLRSSVVNSVAHNRWTNLQQVYSLKIKLK